ncbi:FtsX-like permease family protein [Rhizobiales bacterium RZME27]|uniref:FtsX-like permease family protein n=1 Tax=Endobacterium cereale TaxID=2663029 RepID=A0A6A8A555_9HYPH|nr:ABC transporter permease [Endobacterium cereale]MEB2845055.1 ABC transporter permease [Endobacterium cereale]MQY44967.1 FtsX-like permease family protein [Endobacterium cereale]
MIRFILADLRRLWLGGAVVILLVALATALGVAVTLQERSLRLGSARAADKFDLVVGAPGSETQLILSSIFLQAAPLPLVEGSVLTKLAADPRVSWAAPVGFGDSFAGYPIIGTTTSLISGTTTGFSEGKMFALEGEAVLGAAVDLSIGAEIKPMHGTAETGGHTHAGPAYKVVGKLQPTGTPWDRAILVPIQAVWHVHGLGADHGHHEEHEGEHHDADGHDHSAEGEAHHDDADVHAEGASGHPDTAAHAQEAQQQGQKYAFALGAASSKHVEEDHHGSIDADTPIVETFGASTPGLPAILVKPKTIADAYRLRQEYRSGSTLGVFPGEVLTGLYATLGDAKMVLSAVAAGSQGLVAAALVLVTVIHVGQRRRQIGALRAFGAPRSSVFLIVWLELFLLVALGVGIGFLVGLGAAHVGAQMFTAKSGVILPVGFTREDGRLALILLGFAGVLAAVPALLAYRQSPAQALRA